MGIVEQELHNYKEARSNYKSSLDIKVKCKDEYSQASTYYQLGTIEEEMACKYYKIGMIEEAFQKCNEAQYNYGKAIDIKIKYKDKRSQASTYCNLGIVDEMLANIIICNQVEVGFYFSQKIEDAYLNYRKALEIYTEYSDRNRQADCYYHLGSLDYLIGNFTEARYNYQQALVIYMERKNFGGQAAIYGKFGFLAEAEGEYQEAAHQLIRSLHIFSKHSESKDNTSTKFIISEVKRIYKSHPSDQLLNTIGQAIGCSEAEVLQLFEQL